MPDICTECQAPSMWERHTQFAGVHPYCTFHAQKENDFGKEDGSTFWKQIMDPIDQADILIERTRGMRRILHSKLPTAVKRTEVNGAIELLNAHKNSHPALEKALRDITHDVMQQVKKEEAAALTPIALPTVAAWLESAMGGPASFLVNVRNADHFKVTVDLLPLMKLAGGEWEALAKMHDA